MKFFSTEGALYKFISRFWDMVKLNFIWLVCSLPVITVGVSTIAAYTVTLRMIEEHEGYVVSNFFKAFKENFKQGMAIGPITVLFAAVLYIDFTLAGRHTGFAVLGVFSAFLFVIALIYAYPLLARYENKLFQTIKNSMRIALRYFGRTVFLAVLLVAEAMVFRITNITLIIGLLIGPACMMLTVSGFAMMFFKEIEKEGGVMQKKDADDDRGGDTESNV
ncbi:MAG: DUF624 domain-containing protein [Butyrivibrio sp.]|nr:DUF624 domain-containing protein [Butyrivibrio sp.]